MARRDEFPLDTNYPALIALLQSQHHRIAWPTMVGRAASNNSRCDRLDWEVNVASDVIGQILRASLPSSRGGKHGPRTPATIPDST